MELAEGSRYQLASRALTGFLEEVEGRPGNDSPVCQDDVPHVPKAVQELPEPAGRLSAGGYSAFLTAICPWRAVTEVSSPKESRDIVFWFLMVSLVPPTVPGM